MNITAKSACLKVLPVGKSCIGSIFSHINLTLYMLIRIAEMGMKINSLFPSILEDDAGDWNHRRTTRCWSQNKGLFILLSLFFNLFFYPVESISWLHGDGLVTPCISSQDIEFEGYKGPCFSSSCRISVSWNKTEIASIFSCFLPHI